jgi:hypothetical protein
MNVLVQAAGDGDADAVVAPTNHPKPRWRRGDWDPKALLVDFPRVSDERLPFRPMPQVLAAMDEVYLTEVLAPQAAAAI